VLAADAIIMGVGVRPATTFLKDSGFDFERDGSLSVDEYLRVIGKENEHVYAIGNSNNLNRCFQLLKCAQVTLRRTNKFVAARDV
jgi:NAD(P)H-nitrite reductase large subunit